MFFSFINTCQEFYDFHNEFIKNKDQKEIIEQTMLMDTKDFIFDAIKSELNDKMFPIEITFGEYTIYKISFIVPNALIFVLIS